MRRMCISIAITTAAVLVIVAATAAPAAAGRSSTTRVSVATGGAEADAYSDYPAISALGRYVAFSSSATNLVPGDTNGVEDVFLRDRFTGRTTLVSGAGAGGQANGGSSWPAIGTTGRYVAFASSATNLVADDTNGVLDVFLRDRFTGTTTRISVSSTGSESDGNSYWPAISANGRYIAYLSEATNLVADDTNGVDDVFLRDRLTGTTTRVSLSTVQANGSSGWPSISANGRYVVYQSRATNLVPDDTNNAIDVFLRDRSTGRTTRVSVTGTGGQANHDSYYPVISANGRSIAYTSSATDLVPDDTNGVDDVFLRDRFTGTTRRVSVSSAGGEADRDSYWPAISANGRSIAFASIATNLVPDDTNGVDDIFVRDRGHFSLP